MSRSRAVLRNPAPHRVDDVHQRAARRAAAGRARDRDLALPFRIAHQRLERLRRFAWLDHLGVVDAEHRGDAGRGIESVGVEGRGQHPVGVRDRYRGQEALLHPAHHVARLGEVEHVEAHAVGAALGLDELHHRLGRAPGVFDRDARVALVECGRELLDVFGLDGAAEYDLAFLLGRGIELVHALDGRLRRRRRGVQGDPREADKRPQQHGVVLPFFFQAPSSRQSAGEKLTRTSWLN